MNYIGSVSILDRGDAPAQAVITKNARSLAQRMADETRDELNKVMTRVHTIYGSLENTEEYPTSANMEYLNDIAELQAILGDEIKKRQYQQQVTVFIVGYQDVCHQKLVLLQQVNEFFMENSKKIDEEDWFPTTPDLDMDEVSNTVEDSLNHAHELTNRLSELNQEMVEYIATMAEKKASNKGRKKIEKALQQAKEEVSGLSEKLLRLQTELDDREEKVQTMVKQLESKNMEVQKYRTAAELSKQKIIMLQKEVDEMKKSSEEIKSDMSKFLDSQISALHESHRQEIDELKKQHETEAKKMQEELEDARQELAQAQHELIQLQIQKGVVHGETPSEVGRVFDLADSEPSRQSSVQESRPTTKDTRTSGKSTVSGKQSTKPGSKSPNRLQSKPGSRTSGAKSGKEFAEIAIQDEGGDPDTAVVEDKARTPATRQSRRSKSTLAPVLESDLDNAFDLFDDQAWATVPADQVSGRFAQYRRLSTNRLQDLEEQLQLTTARTKRKVETLKAQFQEHKSKWEAERRVLIEQVDQSLKLQTDAEKEADAAMTQLEDFISEQERLEQEEEVKRSEILHASASLTPAENSTPAGATPTTGTTPKAGTPHPQGDGATPDQELQRLMQQTDDAKVQEMNARLGSCVSAPPAVDLDSASVQRSESLSSLEAMKIEGTTEEEIRTSSALSRASLRETYKAKLDEAKIAAEDRRSKSPAINLPTKMTVDDELITDDDDEGDEYLEEEVALPDELKEEYLKSKDISMYEMGTSPPPAALHTSRDQSHLSKDASGGHTGRGGMDGAGGPFRDPSQPLIQKIVRKGSSLLNHPILQEYLKAYECVVSFKDGMGKMFLDKDMMSAHQMTSDLETLTFDHNQKAMPQVQELTKNVEYVLDELISLINNILVYEREPRVSSLNMLSREPTQKSLIAASLPPAAGGGVITEEKGGATPPTTRDLPSEASSHASVQSGRYSTGSEKKLIQDLQEQYNILKKQLEDASQNHQDQLQRNTVVMMEMQDTINELQRELSTLGKSSKRTKSALSSARGASVHLKSPSPETSVMFTRLDSERNAKIMKKAVMEEKLETEKYKEAVSKMDEYVSLPAQRLAHLVKKYVHHSRMRAIEEKVKNSSSLDQDVFEVLDKMESLQNKRARQWAERMDDMGIERLRMANLLMDTLDHIEQESGIFLIKPMYSYRGRDMKPSHAAKLSRPTRQQNRNATPSHDGASTFIPAPTPASNYRLVRHERYAMQQQQQHVPSTMAELRPSESRQAPDDEVKVAGSGMTFSAGQPNTTWNMQVSQAWAAKDDPGNAYNTPRILELDINRMLIGQNNISTKVPYPPTEDRLVNANQSTLRSYVTVNRPTATFGEKTDTRPTSAQDSARGRSSSARSSSAKRVRVSEVDKGLPEELPSASPLPPITPIPSGQNEEEDEEDEMETAREGKEGVDRPPSVAFSEDIEEHKEPPQSPPGSSLYQSTRLGETMPSDEE